MTQSGGCGVSDKKEGGALRFLYGTAPGRAMLRCIYGRGVSKLCGKYLDSRLSKVLIKKFVKKNNIDLSEYESAEYRSFNEFFTRKIADGRRPFYDAPKALCSPCDGLLSVYEIKDGLVLPVKQSSYTVSSLLGKDPIAERFADGLCLVFRLCVDNYHRYAYFDSGVKEENIYIKGKLHTVRPIALERYPVFVENCREWTLMHTDNFGDAVQIEVGAMLVGKIKNHAGAGSFVRGEEKGMFLYGGSTVILLLERGAAAIDQMILDSVSEGKEYPVKMGEMIGTAAGA
ncbi:MAG: phosphatidylserine decarboxylase [Clostridia bacterium]|nr:phosphatidylserine decarboxylase [Clostridia bacterium]